MPVNALLVSAVIIYVAPLMSVRLIRVQLRKPGILALALASIIRLCNSVMILCLESQLSKARLTQLYISLLPVMSASALRLRLIV